MGTTGLIYVAIVAAWAAYLVPMLLRRSDEVIRRNSAEQYSSANARVLSRQSGDQATARYVVKRPVTPGATVPPGSAGSVPSGAVVPSSVLLPPGAVPPGAVPPGAVPPGGAVRSDAHGPPGPGSIRYVPNRARRVAAMRRRRVLSILTLSLLTVTALASFAMLPWWSTTIPVALIVAFVAATRVQLRRQVRRRAEEQARRRASRAAVHDRGPSAAPVEVEPTVKIERPVEPDSAGQPAAVAPDPPAEGLWDPVPVTLPTYVLKEKAPARTVRTISLSGPEVFSSARAAEVDPEAEPGPVVPDSAPVADEPEEREIRRAVGD